MYAHHVWATYPYFVGPPLRLYSNDVHGSILIIWSARVHTQSPKKNNQKYLFEKLQNKAIHIFINTLFFNLFNPCLLPKYMLKTCKTPPNASPQKYPRAPPKSRSSKLKGNFINKSLGLCRDLSMTRYCYMWCFHGLYKGITPWTE